MSSTQRYLDTGNSVCGTPEEAKDELTHDEVKETIKDGLLYLAKTGFIEVDKDEKVMLKMVFDNDYGTYHLADYFNKKEIEALKQELQEAYDKGGDNLFNPTEYEVVV